MGTGHSVRKRPGAGWRAGGSLTLATLTALALVPAGAAGAELCHGKVPTYVGTPGPDRFTYPSDDAPPQGRDPVISMRGGDDRVRYLIYERHLTVCLGPGSDRVTLGEGAAARSAIVDGGPGGDLVDSAGSTDEVQLPPLTMLGRSGADRMFAGNASDRLVGGGGDDLVYGYFGDDVLLGGAGDDRLLGLGDADRLFGGRGEDLLNGGGQFDRADGGPARDECRRATVQVDCEG
jgi:Ca2+-binding RTX toxin-like protein